MKTTAWDLCLPRETAICSRNSGPGRRCTGVQGYLRRRSRPGARARSFTRGSGRRSKVTPSGDGRMGTAGAWSCGWMRPDNYTGKAADEFAVQSLTGTVFPVASRAVEPTRRSSRESSSASDVAKTKAASLPGVIQFKSLRWTSARAGEESRATATGSARGIGSSGTSDGRRRRTVSRAREIWAASKQAPLHYDGPGVAWLRGRDWPPIGPGTCARRLGMHNIL